MSIDLHLLTLKIFSISTNETDFHISMTEHKGSYSDSSWELQNHAYPKSYYSVHQGRAMPVHSLHTVEVSCSVQGRFGHAGAFSAKKVNSFHSESCWKDRTLTN